MTTIDTPHTLPHVFTWSDAAVQGIRPNRPHKLPIAKLTRDMYTMDATEHPASWLAACQIAGTHSALFGVTALRLWGADLTHRLDGDKRVHVIAPGRQFGSERPEIVVHRGRLQEPPRRVAGIPVTHPVEAWLQVAGSLSLTDNVCLADALLRRQHPLSDVDEMGQLVLASHRRRGIKKVRQALLLCRPGTDSTPETSTRLLLVQHGLPCPEVNVPVEDEEGRVIYYLDMAYRREKVAVEYDGAIHVGERESMQRDRTRHRWLEDHGWRVITVTSADLRDDPGGVVRSVRQALRRASDGVRTPVES